MAKQALDGTRLNAFGMDPCALIVVGLDTKDGPEHTLYDPRIKLPLDDSLIRNIMVYGVQVPVLVRKTGVEEKPEVVDGRQRVRAAREANKLLTKEGKEPVLVPVVVRKGEDHRLYGISVSANEQRKDDSPLAKARKAARFLDMGRSEDDVALAFGCTTQAVKQWLKLLELAPEVLRAVDEGLLTAHQAQGLGHLSKDKQRERIEALKSGPIARKKRQNGAVSKTVLRKVVAAPEVEKVLHPEFVRGLRFALGEVKASEIDGLKDLVKG